MFGCYHFGHPHLIIYIFFVRSFRLHSLPFFRIPFLYRIASRASWSFICVFFSSFLISYVSFPFFVIPRPSSFPFSLLIYIHILLSSPSRSFPSILCILHFNSIPFIGILA
ncbi:hypothetical protein C8J57DRAFT_1294409, partial [Mycena rebaudengoi]